MSAGAAPAIGIDLGSTNAVAAVAIGGNPQVFVDPIGKSPRIPSVVSFTEKGEREVGHPALAGRSFGLSHTVWGITRLLGRPYKSEEVRRAKSRFSFDLREASDGSVMVSTRGGDFTLPEVSSMVLGEVRRVAELGLDQRVGRCVMTVPAHFNELQRSSLKLAGSMADLEVIRVLNEPTAAALAYGYGRGARERICVYDWGGTTFKVTLLEIAGNVFEVRATESDNFLGGNNLDTALADELFPFFCDETGIDAPLDRLAYEILCEAAEVARCSLSTRERAAVEVPFWPTKSDENPYFWYDITRAALNHLMEPFVSRTLDLCRDALHFAGLKASDLSAVILVGGATRAPVVHQRVASFFGREPHASLPPDEVVARGAAILAEALTPGARRKHAVPLPATPKSTPEPRPAETTSFTLSVDDIFGPQESPEGAPSQDEGPRSQPPPQSPLAPPRPRSRRRNHVMVPPVPSEPAWTSPGSTLGASPGVTRERPLAHLRQILVDLYTDPGRARTLVSDSGIPLRTIAFQQAPDAFWWEILQEADKRQRVPALLKHALRDYPEHADLIAAERLLLAPGGAQAQEDRELEALLRERDAQLAEGRDGAALTARIKELRRARRNGPQLHAGEYLSDRFRLVQRLGHGGFATVWEAIDRLSQHRVAVKVLHGQWSHEASRIERFERGARAMMRLDHPHVVRLVHPPGEENGFHYFVMEYAAGGDLQGFVLTRGPALTERGWLQVVTKVGDALQHAHERGVIHRDVKPENILLRADHTPILADFDLAALGGSTGGTRTGGLGTFVYSAPEMSMDAKTADHRADVYSLAMTAVFVLSRRKLGTEAVRKTEAVVKRLACTERVKEALLCALDEDPDARFQNVAAFCRALTGGSEVP